MLLAAALVTVLVQPGDTLSGIAAAHGTSLAAVEAANPQFSSDYNLISVGQSVSIPSGGSYAPSAPSQPTYQPSNPQPVQATAPGGVSIPGMPQGLANCIWRSESSSGTNPAANGNQFGIIPASGYNVAGESVSQQEATAGAIYATTGGAAWASDGCPGT